MIIKEFLNDGTLVKHYSDKGVLLLQNETGDMYGEPVDMVPCPFTYTETEELVNPDEEIEEEEFLDMVSDIL